MKFSKVVVGKLMLLAGVALLTFAICGAAARQLPEYIPYYVAGGTGIVTITAGLLAGAIPLDS
jgi:hypothetical protein